MIFFFKQTIRDRQGRVLGDVTAGFDVTKVLKTVQGQHGGLVVIMDDGHEESQIVYKRHANGEVALNKKNEPIEEGRVRNWTVSEFELDLEDTKRYMALVSADGKEYPLHYVVTPPPSPVSLEAAIEADLKSDEEVVEEKKTEEVGALAD